MVGEMRALQMIDAPPEARHWDASLKHPGDGGFEKELITPDPPADLTIDCTPAPGGVVYTLELLLWSLEEENWVQQAAVPNDVIIDGREHLVLRFQQAGDVPGFKAPLSEGALAAIGRASRSITVTYKARSIVFDALGSDRAI